MGDFAPSDVQLLLEDRGGDHSHENFKSLRYPARVGSNYPASDDLSCYKILPKKQWTSQGQQAKSVRARNIGQIGIGQAHINKQTKPNLHAYLVTQLPNTHIHKLGTQPNTKPYI